MEQKYGTKLQSETERSLSNYLQVAFFVIRRAMKNM